MTVRPLDLTLMDIDDSGKVNGAFQHHEEPEEKVANRILKKAAFQLNEKPENSSPDLKRRKRRVKYQSTLDDFVASSTLHGLKHCFKAPSRFQRAIWVIFLCAAFGYFLYLLVTSFQLYLTYPIKTKLTIVNQDRSVFPAVTICNYNMFRKNKVKGTIFEDFIQQITVRASGNNTAFNSTKFNFTNTSDMYVALSHDMDEMLFHCVWQGAPCNSSYFRKRFTSMGACYTFNSGADGSRLLHVKSPGKWFGLELLLNAQQEEYISFNGMESAGFKILLHDQNEPPLVDNDGFAISPGTHTLVSVLKKKVKALKAPYESDCRDESIPHYPVYTRSACTEYCYVTHIYRSCGCFPIQLTELVNDSLICNPNQYVTCVGKADYAFLQRETTCKCPDPCDSVVYEPSLSYGQFPSEANIRAVSGGAEKGLNLTYEETKDWVRRNLVLLNIFYKELNYEFVEQSPGYTELDLLSSIGGQLGLFAGASILTLHEFADLFINLLAVKFGYR